MYHTSLPVESESPVVNLIPWQTNDDYGGQNLPVQYINDIIQLDHVNNYNFNQNINSQSHEGIEDWFQGCQVLGFIPDNSSGPVNIPVQNYPTGQGCYKFSHDYDNKRSGKVYQCCSTQSKQNNLRINLKRKRKRTIFKTEQIVALEELYQRKPYINREERVELMNKLQVSEKSIKIWFQNRRRMADKKEYPSDSPSSFDTTDSFADRLNFIEAQINENTDENGNVTLSDVVMNELACVIDEYLSKDVNEHNREIALDTQKVNNIVMYEPISPASSEDEDSRIVLESEQYLQRLSRHK